MQGPNNCQICKHYNFRGECVSNCPSFDYAAQRYVFAEMDGSWSNYPYFESGTIAVTSQKEGLFLVRYRPRAVSQ